MADTEKTNLKTETKTKVKTTKIKPSVAEKLKVDSSSELKTEVKVEKTTKPSRIAILQINNLQYIVREGEKILTRISPKAVKEDINVKLLGIIDGDNFEYGKPYLDYAVDFDLGEMVKGDKVTSFKYKHKARYRRKVGFRKKFVEITLNSITA